MNDILFCRICGSEILDGFCTCSDSSIHEPPTVNPSQPPPTNTDTKLAAAEEKIKELREVIKRQAASAKMGMDAAHAASSEELKLAKQIRAESSPEMLESERQANALLTERITALENALKPFAEIFSRHEAFLPLGTEIIAVPMRDLRHAAAVLKENKS